MSRGLGRADRRIHPVLEWLSYFYFLFLPFILFPIQYINLFIHCFNIIRTDRIYLFFSPSDSQLLIFFIKSFWNLPLLFLLQILFHVFFLLFTTLFWIIIKWNGCSWNTAYLSLCYYMFNWTIIICYLLIKA